jgi:saccharopine dehydrogenase-like NADP-dependent oxidoreductase
MRFVLGLGLAEERRIGVHTHLTYRDILVRRLRDTLGGTYEDAVLMRVLIQGEIDGEPRSLLYEMVERYDASEKLTAMMRCTALPTVTIARLIAEKDSVASGGADVPENVVPHDVYLNRVHDRGLNIRSEWFDGPVEITSKKRLQRA